MKAIIILLSLTFSASALADAKSIRAEQNAIVEDQRQTVILLEKARADSDFEMIHFYQDRMIDNIKKVSALEKEYQSSPDVVAEREHHKNDVDDLFNGLANSKNKRG
ncbi:hypothetical protein [Serratia quinivorans]|uniref:hypothetical protein n=1 Tax=Serratia quinivorans TaxID=137545 RepID=UPI002178CB32|nr:hypothetical protein [Serratia quinivorans]CAI0910670.1 Uncharacterised protein [Serratia quinivorans]CAI2095912.1 Uncharacterised protein [Serratia quinivorans]